MLFPAFLAIVVDAVIFSFFKACRIQISERKEKGGGGGRGGGRGAGKLAHIKHL